MLQYLLTWIRAQKPEEGQDLAEYALLIALIAIALVAVLVVLQGGLSNVFNRINNDLANAITTP